MSFSFSSGKTQDTSPAKFFNFKIIMNARILAKTEGYLGTEYQNKSLDEITVGIARISSSREVNDLFDEPHKLLRHCISNGHWSVFGTTNLVIEIITSRAIGREYLRHYSLAPQEISQRYVQILNFEEIELREQSKNNRQSSTQVIDPYINVPLNPDEHEIQASEAVNRNIIRTNELYQELIKNGVAKESARMILPETTQTKIVFNGTIRSWVTTLNQRLHQTAQKEARLIAEGIRDLFIKECPVISSALFNFEDAYDIHILDKVVLEKYGVFNQIKENGFKKIKT